MYDFKPTPGQDPAETYRQLIDAVFGADSERVVAFDPTFIPKAGPHTFGRQRFWNSAKNRAEKTSGEDQGSTPGVTTCPSSAHAGR